VGGPQDNQQHRQQQQQAPTATTQSQQRRCSQNQVENPDVYCSQQNYQINLINTPYLAKAQKNDWKIHGQTQ